VAAEARFAQRSQQVLQRLEAQKIERFVGDFEARCLGLRPSPAPGPLSRPASARRDVAFVGQLLHQIFQQLVHLLRRHGCSRSSICCSGRRVEQLAAFERLLDGRFRSSRVLLVPLG
jgi:hypothetical protein